MNTLTVADRSSTGVATPVSPRAMGRPTGFSEGMAGRLCEVIRRRGFSDSRAAVTLGFGRSTISDWKREHPELGEWLEMAREQYRESKLTIVDEAKTKDGRPEWKAAVWALEKAFPEDYGKGAGRRQRERGKESWVNSATILEREFPEEFGEPLMRGLEGAAADSPGASGARTGFVPNPELMAALIEENEELRAQLRELIPETPES